MCFHNPFLSNCKGAIVGGLCGIAINMWIALGSFIYGRKAPLSKPISTSGCLQNETDVAGLNGTFSNGSFYSTTIDKPYILYSNETTTVYAQ